MEDSAHKTKIIYKGDVYAGSLYFLIGLFTVFSAIAIYYFTSRLGFYYLSIGLSLFAVYMLLKGSLMVYLYSSRFRFYKNYTSLNLEEIKEERRYTRWRILKKKKNRRRYIYSILIVSVVAFLGIFHQEKGLIIATCIPIILMSAIEFSIGLLTEFRLSEYLKHLHRTTLSLTQSSNNL